MNLSKNNQVPQAVLRKIELLSSLIINMYLFMTLSDFALSSYQARYINWSIQVLYRPYEILYILNFI